MNEPLSRGAEFIWGNARLLERAIFDYRFLQGSPDKVLAALSAYQNDDGGFGNALEPDLRAPDSQPLFVEFALRTLYDCGLRAPELTKSACDFLARHSDLEAGIATRFASSNLYPRAEHWHYARSEQPEMDRLTSLVGLANWQGIRHPWLQKAVAACLDYISKTRFAEAHTLRNAFCLVESISTEARAGRLFDKLSAELLEAEYFCLEAPVTTYCLTPLEFAPSPESYCNKIFTEAQLAGHLDELVEHQEPDGGWPILWEPPSEAARLEWRAYKTLTALTTLRAYRWI